MTKSNHTLPAFPPFTLDEYGTISTRWRKYKKRFENLVLALNVHDGDEAYDVYESLSTGRPDKTYDAVTALLDGQFLSQSNITYEGYLFQNLRQNVNENIHQFYIRVKEQAVKCNYSATVDTEIK